MREPFSLLYAHTYCIRVVLSPNGFTGAQLALDDEMYDPRRPLAAASNSSYVRINSFGIDETLKLEIVTATLSANDPRRAPGWIGYLFDLNDDSRLVSCPMRGGG